jgi:hypothetical protein
LTPASILSGAATGHAGSPPAPLVVVESSSSSWSTTDRLTTDVGLRERPAIRVGSRAASECKWPSMPAASRPHLARSRRERCPGGMLRTVLRKRAPLIQRRSAIRPRLDRILIPSLDHPKLDRSGHFLVDSGLFPPASSLPKASMTGMGSRYSQNFLTRPSSNLTMKTYSFS